MRLFLDSAALNIFGIGTRRDAETRRLAFCLKTARILCAAAPPREILFFGLLRRYLRSLGVCLFIFGIFLLPGCTGLVQRGGELLEGNAFVEMELALYRSDTRGGKIVELRELRLEDGNLALEITSSEWPGLAIRGAMPDYRGGFELYEARFLSSHVHGWNEFTMDIYGKAVFEDHLKTGGILLIEGEVDRADLSAGRIRLKGSRITGGEALTSLRNRRERILAFLEWESESAENRDAAVFSAQKEFENYWKPLLFPELVSGGRRPLDYSALNAEWVRVDSVNWNTAWTRFFFPEGLWEYRNSGAMLRDWEEALPWIYMEYSWNKVIDSFNGVSMQKIR